MKKKAIDAACFAVAILSMALMITGSGCSTLAGSSDATPAEAGFEVVEAYVVARPFIAEEHRAIIAEIYSFATTTDDLDTVTDDLLREAVQELFSKAEPEEREAVLVVFKRAKDRLLEQIDLNPDMEKAALIAEFFQGVEEAVDYYGLTPGGA